MTTLRNQMDKSGQRFGILSVEKELGSQLYPSLYEADDWTPRKLKSPNCTMGATLRTRRFGMQERIEASKTVARFGVSSLDSS
jgi:hypothetical protein